MPYSYVPCYGAKKEESNWRLRTASVLITVKKSILLGEVTVAILVDLNVICRRLEKTGTRAWIKDGLLNVERRGNKMAVGWHILNGLRYECLSTATALKYIQHVLASETHARALE